MKKFFHLTVMTAAMLLVFSSFALNGNTAEEPKEHSNYILIFQATEYDSKMGDAIEFFFKEILKPEDYLSIITPANPYNFPPQTRQAYPIEKLISRTQEVLKRDITVGLANYNVLLENMMQLVREISGDRTSISMGSDLKNNMVQYRQLLENMRNLRKLNENLFLQLAGIFKKGTGKNYLYIFYQKELRIIPNNNVLQQLKQSYEFKADATELFEQDNDEKFMDVQMVNLALQDAKVTLNFIYLNKNAKPTGSFQFKEFSGDVYNVLSQLATTSGGFVEATSKPEAVLKKYNEKK